jgi:SAM-dependent methyltransferase
MMKSRKPDARALCASYKVPKGLRLLDVGCGGGRFLRLCKQLGSAVQGVEPSPIAAKMTRDQGLDVFTGTLEEYAAQTDAKFDVITASHVIEHVPDPVGTLKTMKSLLAPDGYIWIHVPNAAYLIARALKGRWFSSDLPYHLMHFGPISMEIAGTKAGLEIRTQYTESQPEHVTASLSQLLRIRFFVPYRLASRSALVRSLASWYAKRADQKCNGEGLITEFVS